jgi:16S rRNA (cytidine1402-2'-O)-methyltransferase
LGNFTIGRHEFNSPKPEPGLYVVSTPIGNLSDITIRALEILAGADLLACEDTRVTAKLLSRYGISVKRRAYHEHNADQEGPALLDRIRNGEVIALVSDAGTPLVSDPGQRLVAAARAEGLPVFPVPGASAPLAALAACGLPTGKFTFVGFLPTRKNQRTALLETFRGRQETLVFFESPSRLASALEDMAAVFGADHVACVGRELTKLHEELRRASLEDLAAHYHDTPPKGEIVIVLAPHEQADELDMDTMLKDLMATMSVSRAAGEAARLSGLSKRDLYQRALALKGEGE